MVKKYKSIDSFTLDPALSVKLCDLARDHIQELNKDIAALNASSLPVYPNVTQIVGLPVLVGSNRKEHHYYADYLTKAELQRSRELKRKLDRLTAWFREQNITEQSPRELRDRFKALSFLQQAHLKEYQAIIYASALRRDASIPAFRRAESTNVVIPSQIESTQRAATLIRVSHALERAKKTGEEVLAQPESGEDEAPTPLKLLLSRSKHLYSTFGVSQAPGGTLESENPFDEVNVIPEIAGILTESTRSACQPILDAGTKEFKILSDDEFVDSQRYIGFTDGELLETYRKLLCIKSQAEELVELQNSIGFKPWHSFISQRQTELTASEKAAITEEAGSIILQTTRDQIAVLVEMQARMARAFQMGAGLAYDASTKEVCFDSDTAFQRATQTPLEILHNGIKETHYLWSYDVIAYENAIDGRDGKVVKSRRTLSPKYYEAFRVRISDFIRKGSIGGEALRPNTTDADERTPLLAGAGVAAVKKLARVHVGKLSEAQLALNNNNGLLSSLQGLFPGGAINALLQSDAYAADQKIISLQFLPSVQLLFSKLKGFSEDPDKNLAAFLHGQGMNALVCSDASGEDVFILDMLFRQAKEEYLKWRNTLPSFGLTARRNHLLQIKKTLDSMFGYEARVSSGLGRTARRMARAVFGRGAVHAPVYFNPQGEVFEKLKETKLKIYRTAREEMESQLKSMWSAHQNDLPEKPDAERVVEAFLRFDALHKAIASTMTTEEFGAYPRITFYDEAIRRIRSVVVPKEQRDRIRGLIQKISGTFQAEIFDTGLTSFEDVGLLTSDFGRFEMQSKVMLEVLDVCDLNVTEQHLNLKSKVDICFPEGEKPLPQTEEDYERHPASDSANKVLLSMLSQRYLQDYLFEKGSDRGVSGLQFNKTTMQNEFLNANLIRFIQLNRGALELDKIQALLRSAVLTERTTGHEQYIRYYAAQLARAEQQNQLSLSRKAGLNPAEIVVGSVRITTPLENGNIFEPVNILRLYQTLGKFGVLDAEDRGYAQMFASCAPKIREYVTKFIAAASAAQHAYDAKRTLTGRLATYLPPGRHHDAVRTLGDPGDIIDFAASIFNYHLACDNFYEVDNPIFYASTLKRPSLYRYHVGYRGDFDDDRFIQKCLDDPRVSGKFSRRSGGKTLQNLIDQAFQLKLSKLKLLVDGDLNHKLITTLCRYGGVSSVEAMHMQLIKELFYSDLSEKDKVPLIVMYKNYLKMLVEASRIFSFELSSEVFERGAGFLEQLLDRSLPLEADALMESDNKIETFYHAHRTNSVVFSNFCVESGQFFQSSLPPYEPYEQAKHYVEDRFDLQSGKEPEHFGDAWLLPIPYFKERHGLDYLQRFVTHLYLHFLLDDEDLLDSSATRVLSHIYRMQTGHAGIDIEGERAEEVSYKHDDYTQFLFAGCYTDEQVAKRYALISGVTEEEVTQSREQYGKERVHAENWLNAFRDFDLKANITDGLLRILSEFNGEVAFQSEAEALLGFNGIQTRLARQVYTYRAIPKDAKRDRNLQIMESQFLAKMRNLYAGIVAEIMSEEGRVDASLQEKQANCAILINCFIDARESERSHQGVQLSKETRQFQKPEVKKALRAMSAGFTNIKDHILEINAMVKLKLGERGNGLLAQGFGITEASFVASHAEDVAAAAASSDEGSVYGAGSVSKTGTHQTAFTRATAGRAALPAGYTVSFEDWQSACLPIGNDLLGRALTVDGQLDAAAYLDKAEELVNSGQTVVVRSMGYKLYDNPVFYRMDINTALDLFHFASRSKKAGVLADPVILKLTELKEDLRKLVSGGQHPYLTAIDAFLYIVQNGVTGEEGQAYKSVLDEFSKFILGASVFIRQLYYGFGIKQAILTQAVACGGRADYLYNSLFRFEGTLQRENLQLEAKFATESVGKRLTRASEDSLRIRFQQQAAESVKSRMKFMRALIMDLSHRRTDFSSVTEDLNGLFFSYPPRGMVAFEPILPAEEEMVPQARGRRSTTPPPASAVEAIVREIEFNQISLSAVLDIIVELETFSFIDAALIYYGILSERGTNVDFSSGAGELLSVLEGYARRSIDTQLSVLPAHISSKLEGALQACFSAFNGLFNLEVEPNLLLFRHSHANALFVLLQQKYCQIKSVKQSVYGFTARARLFLAKSLSFCEGSELFSVQNLNSEVRVKFLINWLRVFGTSADKDWLLSVRKSIISFAASAHVEPSLFRSRGGANYRYIDAVVTEIDPADRELSVNLRALGLQGVVSRDVQTYVENLYFENLPCRVEYRQYLHAFIGYLSGLYPHLSHIVMLMSEHGVLEVQDLLVLRIDGLEPLDFLELQGVFKEDLSGYLAIEDNKFIIELWVLMLRAVAEDAAIPYSQAVFYRYFDQDAKADKVIYAHPYASALHEKYREFSDDLRKQSASDALQKIKKVYCESFEKAALAESRRFALIKEADLVMPHAYTMCLNRALVLLANKRHDLFKLVEYVLNSGLTSFEDLISELRPAERRLHIAYLEEHLEFGMTRSLKDALLDKSTGSRKIFDAMLLLKNQSAHIFRVMEACNRIRPQLEGSEALRIFFKWMVSNGRTRLNQVTLHELETADRAVRPALVEAWMTLLDARLDEADVNLLLRSGVPILAQNLDLYEEVSNLFDQIGGGVLPELVSLEAEFDTAAAADHRRSSLYDANLDKAKALAINISPQLQYAVNHIFDLIKEQKYAKARAAFELVVNHYPIKELVLVFNLSELSLSLRRSVFKLKENTFFLNGFLSSGLFEKIDQFVQNAFGQPIGSLGFTDELFVEVDNPDITLSSAANSAQVIRYSVSQLLSMLSSLHGDDSPAEESSDIMATIRTQRVQQIREEQFGLCLHYIRRLVEIQNQPVFNACLDTRYQFTDSLKAELAYFNQKTSLSASDVERLQGLFQELQALLNERQAFANTINENMASLTGDAQAGCDILSGSPTYSAGIETVTKFSGDFSLRRLIRDCCSAVKAAHTGESDAADPLAPLQAYVNYVTQAITPLAYRLRKRLIELLSSKDADQYGGNPKFITLVQELLQIPDENRQVIVDSLGYAFDVIDRRFSKTEDYGVNVKSAAEILHEELVHKYYNSSQDGQLRGVCLGSDVSFRDACEASSEKMAAFFEAYQATMAQLHVYESDSISPWCLDFLQLKVKLRDITDYALELSQGVLHDLKALFLTTFGSEVEKCLAYLGKFQMTGDRKTIIFAVFDESKASFQLKESLLAAFGKDQRKIRSFDSAIRLYRALDTFQARCSGDAIMQIDLVLSEYQAVRIAVLEEVRLGGHNHDSRFMKVFQSLQEGFSLEKLMDIQRLLSRLQQEAESEGSEVKCQQACYELSVAPRLQLVSDQLYQPLMTFLTKGHFIQAYQELLRLLVHGQMDFSVNSEEGCLRLSRLFRSASSAASAQFSIQDLLVALLSKAVLPHEVLRRLVDALSGGQTGIDAESFHREDLQVCFSDRAVDALEAPVTTLTRFSRMEPLEVWGMLSSRKIAPLTGLGSVVHLVNPARDRGILEDSITALAKRVIQAAFEGRMIEAGSADEAMASHLSQVKLKFYALIDRELLQAGSHGLNALVAQLQEAGATESRLIAGYGLLQFLAAYLCHQYGRTVGDSLVPTEQKLETFSREFSDESALYKSHIQSLEDLLTQFGECLKQDSPKEKVLAFLTNSLSLSHQFASLAERLAEFDFNRNSDLFELLCQSFSEVSVTLHALYECIHPNLKGGVHEGLHPEISGLYESLVSARRLMADRRSDLCSTHNLLTDLQKVVVSARLAVRPTERLHKESDAIHNFSKNVKALQSKKEGGLLAKTIQLCLDASKDPRRRAADAEDPMPEAGVTTVSALLYAKTRLADNFRTAFVSFVHDNYLSIAATATTKQLTDVFSVLKVLGQERILDDIKDSAKREVLRFVTNQFTAFNLEVRDPAPAVKALVFQGGEDWYKHKFLGAQAELLFSLKQFWQTTLEKLSAYFIKKDGAKIMSPQMLQDFIALREGGLIKDNGDLLASWNASSKKQVCEQYQLYRQSITGNKGLVAKRLVFILNQLAPLYREASAIFVADDPSFAPRKLKASLLLFKDIESVLSQMPASVARDSSLHSSNSTFEANLKSLKETSEAYKIDNRCKAVMEASLSFLQNCREKSEGYNASLTVLADALRGQRQSYEACLRREAGSITYVDAESVGISRKEALESLAREIELDIERDEQLASSVTLENTVIVQSNKLLREKSEKVYKFIRMQGGYNVSDLLEMDPLVGQEGLPDDPGYRFNEAICLKAREILAARAAAGMQVGDKSSGAEENALRELLRAYNRHLSSQFRSPLPQSEVLDRSVQAVQILTEAQSYLNLYGAKKDGLNAKTEGYNYDHLTSIERTAVQAEADLGDSPAYHFNASVWRAVHEALNARDGAGTPIKTVLNGKPEQAVRRQLEIYLRNFIATEYLDLVGLLSSSEECEQKRHLEYALQQLDAYLQKTIADEDRMLPGVEEGQACLKVLGELLHTDDLTADAISDFPLNVKTPELTQALAAFERTKTALASQKDNFVSFQETIQKHQQNTRIFDNFIVVIQMTFTSFKNGEVTDITEEWRNFRIRMSGAPGFAKLGIDLDQVAERIESSDLFSTYSQLRGENVGDDEAFITALEAALDGMPLAREAGEAAADYIIRLEQACFDSQPFAVFLNTFRESVEAKLGHERRLVEELTEQSQADPMDQQHEASKSAFQGALIQKLRASIAGRQAERDQKTADLADFITYDRTLAAHRTDASGATPPPVELDQPRPADYNRQLAVYTALDKLCKTERHLPGLFDRLDAVEEAQKAEVVDAIIAQLMAVQIVLAKYTKVVLEDITYASQAVIDQATSAIEPWALMQAHRRIRECKSLLRAVQLDACRFESAYIDSCDISVVRGQSYTRSLAELTVLANQIYGRDKHGAPVAPAQDSQYDLLTREFRSVVGFIESLRKDGLARIPDEALRDRVESVSLELGALPDDLSFTPIDHIAETLSHSSDEGALGASTPPRPVPVMPLRRGGSDDTVNPYSFHSASAPAAPVRAAYAKAKSRFSGGVGQNGSLFGGATRSSGSGSFSSGATRASTPQSPRRTPTPKHGAADRDA